METPKISLDAHKSDDAVQKVFEDAYTALYEQPIHATEEELRALSKTLLAAMPTMEKCLRDPEWASKALHFVTFMAYAREGDGTVFPEDAEAGDAARRIVFENRDYILQRAVEEDAGEGVVLFRAIEALEADPQYREFAQAIIATEMKKAGFDYAELRELWKKASNPMDKESALHIMRLEHRYPSLPKTLNEDFGIVNFRRYPESVLVQQFEMRERTDIPYGILLFPIDDHNGAFSGNSDDVGTFADSLGDSYALRIVECDSKFDIAKRLISLERRYADAERGHKISFAVIGGHGNENLIVFGGEDERHRLLKTDFAGKSAGRIASYFVENPTLILASCSTGKDGAIAQDLSTTLHATVIAPDGNTKLPAIRYKKDSGTFAVDYHNVPAVEYINGVRQNSI